MFEYKLKNGHFYRSLFRLIYGYICPFICLLLKCMFAKTINNHKSYLSITLKKYTSKASTLSRIMLTIDDESMLSGKMNSDHIHLLSVV